MSLPPDAPRPRLCHVIKSSPSQEYGFDLHAERVRGQFIGNVDANSPAAEAGLLRGDRIIAVNGVSIQQENHKDVVKRIKEDPMQCRLVVLDEEGYTWYNEQKLEAPIDGDYVIDARENHQHSTTNIQQHQPIIAVEPPTYNELVEENLTVHDDQHKVHDRREETAVVVVEEEEEERRREIVEGMNNLKHSPHFEVSNHEDSLAFKPRPRLCKLKKTRDDDEYGFNLHAERGKGHFIGKVDSNSIAERAGLEEGQRIVGVNNTLIYPESIHKDVVSLIKQSPKETELLVAFPEIDNWYRNHQTEFSFDDAETVQFADEPSVYKPHHPVALNGNVSHETPIIPVTKVHEISEEPVITAKAENRFKDGKAYTNVQTSYQEVNETHHHAREDSYSKTKQPPSPVVATRHNETSPPESTSSYTRPPHSNGAPDLFNMSVSEVRERLSSRKKNDPRRENRQDLTLKQKYDIVQNL